MNRQDTKIAKILMLLLRPAQIRRKQEILGVLCALAVQIGLRREACRAIVLLFKNYTDREDYAAVVWNTAAGNSLLRQWSAADMS